MAGFQSDIWRNKHITMEVRTTFSYTSCAIAGKEGKRDFVNAAAMVEATGRTVRNTCQHDQRPRRAARGFLASWTGCGPPGLVGTADVTYALIGII
eukprot:5901241-Pyramimonas_sp.AAC.2